MGLFKKIGTGLKNAAKATGKGIGNAAKFTVKNPLKVLGPVAAVAGTVLTAGALAPSLAPALAATKVGSTVFGKMITKTLSTGTIVRSKIAKTLKKQGKKATKSEIDTVEKGLQEEIIKRNGFALPVDSTSQSGTEARKKLAEIQKKLVESNLTDAQEKLRATMQAERQVLIDNPNTNGILSKSDLSEDVLSQMKDAGDIKVNVLGNTTSLGTMLGLNPSVQEKAIDVLDILTGRNKDPYLKEDAEAGVKHIESQLNAGSFDPMNIIKTPIFWVVIGIGVIIYLFKR